MEEKKIIQLKQGLTTAFTITVMRQIWHTSHSLYQTIIKKGVR